MTFDTTKETMVSFLVPSQILETIEDIRDFEGNPSRSSIIRRLLNKGLKSYYDSEKNKFKIINKTDRWQIVGIILHYSLEFLLIHDIKFSE